MNLVSLLFGFSGRINRVQYWLGCVIAGVGGAMLFFTLAILTMPTGGMPKDPMQALPTLAFAAGVPFALMLWAGSALQTKRLHDRGRSALWAMSPLLPILMIVVNIVSGFTSGQHPEQVAASIVLWLFLLQAINLVMFVDIGCLAGRPDANRHGPPPGGGFSGGGGPSSGAPIPGKAKPAPQAIPGMGSTLVSAESAIDRAIAARARQAQAPVPQPQQRPAPRPSTPAPAAPAAPLRPATGGSFGRKVTP